MAQILRARQELNRKALAFGLIFEAVDKSATLTFDYHSEKVSLRLPVER